jgi:hypothetical protein
VQAKKQATLIYGLSVISQIWKRFPVHLRPP